VRGGKPIGWISTLSNEGTANLAPFSQFQNLTFDPNQSTREKRQDFVKNAEQTGEFMRNMFTYDLREAVNKSGGEVLPNNDEFAFSGITNP